MINIEIGQELEFIESANTYDGVIEKGTRVRVGHIMPELVEPKITLIVLGKEPLKTLIVERHVLALHCRLISKSS